MMTSFTALSNSVDNIEENEYSIGELIEDGVVGMGGELLSDISKEVGETYVSYEAEYKAVVSGIDANGTMMAIYFEDAKLVVISLDTVGMDNIGTQTINTLRVIE